MARTDALRALAAPDFVSRQKVCLRMAHHVSARFDSLQRAPARGGQVLWIRRGMMTRHVLAERRTRLGSSVHMGVIVCCPCLRLSQVCSLLTASRLVRATRHPAVGGPVHALKRLDVLLFTDWLACWATCAKPTQFVFLFDTRSILHTILSIRHDAMRSQCRAQLALLGCSRRRSLRP